MDIFDLSIEDFKEEMKKLVDEYTPEKLLQQLKECGYKEDECSMLMEEVNSEEYIICDNLEMEECIDFLTVHSEDIEDWRLTA